MSTDPQALLMIAGGIGSVGLIAAANRRSIALLKDFVYGPERAADGGLEGQQESLSAKLNDIRTRQRRNERERETEHQQVREELDDLGEQVQGSFSALCQQLDDVDADDVVPDDER